MAFAYLLSRFIGLTGVALAFSLAYTALALALLVAMRREIKRLAGRGMAVSFVKILAAGAAMYAVAKTGLYFTGPGSGLLDRAAILALVGGGSLAAYLGVALLLGTSELKSALALVRRREVPPNTAT